MEYEYFLGMFKQYESENIQASSANFVCTATKQIPKPFGLLIRDILAILEQNINSICAGLSESIVITGFRPANFIRRSAKSKLLNRTMAPSPSEEHFCCTLDYQIVIRDRQNAVWERTKSLVVDFSTGEVMSNEYYLSILAHSKLTLDNGLFGMINDTLLETVWQMVRIRHRSKLAQVA